MIRERWFWFRMRRAGGSGAWVYTTVRETSKQRAAREAKSILRLAIGHEREGEVEPWCGPRDFQSMDSTPLPARLFRMQHAAGDVWMEPL